MTESQYKLLVDAVVKLMDAINPTPDKDEAPKAKETQEEQKPVVEMTKDEAKKILVDLSGKGVDVPGIMQSMGYKKLGEVPPEQYAELCAKAKAAL